MLGQARVMHPTHFGVVLQMPGHRQLDEAQQIKAGVLPDMVRMSVGLEHIDDILWDIDQALDQA